MAAVIIIVVIVVIAALVASAVLIRRNRLRRQFGPEYDRAVTEHASRLGGEAELADRQRRVRKLDIRPLTDNARRGYADEWMAIQERFVDNPEAAASEAYALVTTVMAERGYPDTDDEQAMADLSVDHAQTVGHFRSARQITQQITGNGRANDARTEDLRQALIHYRALFSDLLDDTGPGGLSVARNGTAANAVEPLDTAPPATPLADVNDEDALPPAADSVTPTVPDEAESTWR